MPAGRGQPEVAASLMCADFSRLGDQLHELREAAVSRLHLDFADGAFVPSLLLGTEVFGMLAGHEGFMLESHLMVRDPSRFVAAFAAQSDVVIVHVEATPDLSGCIERILGAGARVGLAVSPDTDVEVLAPFIHIVNQVLIMTVQPGFAGATFLPEMIGKVRWVRNRAVDAGLEIDVEVDGGINPATIPDLAAAGANVFVGGSTGLFVQDGIGDSAARMLAAAGRRPPVDRDET